MLFRSEFRDVDVPSGVLKDNIMPLPYKEPSAVLYQLLGTIVDEVFLAFKIKSEVNKNYSDPKERKGAIFYGIMRALQLRQLRLPPPTVKIGGASKEFK